jgi:hypothetical protein
MLELSALVLPLDIVEPAHSKADALLSVRVDVER